MFSNDFERLKKNLERRGFTVHAVQNAHEALRVGLALIGPDPVGMSGSATLHELGLYDALKAQGNEVYSHTYAPEKEKAAVRLKATRAKWFAASTNAITEDGVLVNIDGAGNRVTAMVMGPEKVILFIGKNKLAKDITSGIERIKRVTCPLNARRLGLNTLPCGRTGRCADCASAERMCRVTVIIDNVSRLIEEFHLVLIDEEIGW